MKRTNNKTRYRRGPELPDSYDTGVPFRATEPAGLEQLKERLLAEALAQNSGQPGLNSAYRRAANDAASLAWVTPFPLLFLPALFEEKAAEARRRTDRQRTMLNRSAKWKAVA